MRLLSALCLTGVFISSSAGAQAPGQKQPAAPASPSATPAIHSEQVWWGVSVWWANQREVVISGVLQDGPAGRGGLKIDDTILEIGGRPIHNMDDFQQAYGAFRPGQKVTIEIEREGNRQTVTITPEKFPSDGGIGRLTAAAEAGETWAMVELGVRYGQFLDEFSFVEHDEEEAARWFRHANNMGDTLAPLYLGLMYLDGVGVPQDVKYAQELFRKARLLKGNGVRKGVASAASNQLAAMCLNGQGVAADPALAFRFFHDGANHGSLFAMHQLGTMLEQGLGTEKNLAQSARWYQLAAEMGYSRSVQAFVRLDIKGVVPADQRGVTK